MKYANSILVTIAVIVTVQAFQVTFWEASNGSQETAVEITRFPPAQSQPSPAVITPVFPEWSGPRRPTPSRPKGTNKVSPASRQEKAVAQTPRARPTSQPSQKLDPLPGASVTTIGRTPQSRQGGISRSNRTSRTPSRNMPSSLWSRQGARGRSQPGTASPGVAAGQQQGAESSKKDARPGQGNTPRPPVRGSMNQPRRPR